LDHDLVAFGDRLHVDSADGFAIRIADDNVLRDVDQTAGEVSRVGCLEGCVYKTLTGAVTGDDVLSHVQAFAEIGFNRQVDDLTLRVSHQAPHSHQLTNLRDITSGARERHHVHRVQAVEIVDDFFGQLVGGGGPGVDNLVVTLHFRNLAALVTALRQLDFFVCRSNEFTLLLRHIEVLNDDGN